MNTQSALYQADLEQTLANRARLKANANLMYWYRRLYDELFSDEADLAKLKILEIGSGTSPLKQFLPSVTTSDVLELDYLDMVFDCHRIADLSEIPDGSLDIITLTNVLHHLRDPLAFLHGAARKLTKGGRVYIAEPYFSVLSYPLYRFLHHEPVEFGIGRPMLDKVNGPLSTSNQAMPHMIFFSRRDWLAELSPDYDLTETRLRHFTGISYPLTGGISRKFPVPSWFYKPAFAADHALAKHLPKLFASFFMAKLVTAR